jgi:hypothetical protein
MRATGAQQGQAKALAEWPASSAVAMTSFGTTDMSLQSRASQICRGSMAANDNAFDEDTSV